MTSNDPDNRPIGEEPPRAAEPQPTYVAPQPTAAAAPQTPTTYTSDVKSAAPGGAEMGRRVTVLLFGLIQVVIVLRVVLLLLDAREGNAIVSGILDVSQFFVGPFEGILKTDALASGGSILDVSALVALVGWTVLELIVIWALGVFRRGPASA
jgi:hypothetical protein